MIFKIFQIRLSKEERDQVNLTGHDSVPKQKFKLNLHDRKISSDYVRNGFNYFNHVANIIASDLNDVWVIGNIGVENQIEKFDRMTSLSVGDIIQNESGFQFLIQSYGFKNLGLAQ